MRARGARAGTDPPLTSNNVRMLQWSLLWRVLFGRAAWRWVGPNHSAAAARRALFLGRYWAGDTITEIVQWVWVGGERALRTLGLASWPEYSDDAVSFTTPPAQPDAANAAAFGAQTARWRSGGNAVLYSFWAVFLALSVVYGRLALELAGASAQAQLVRAWAVGVGLSQLAGLQAFALSAAELLMTGFALEGLWLLPNSRWLEQLVDFSSVQASVWSWRSHTGKRRRRNMRLLRAYLEHAKTLS